MTEGISEAQTVSQLIGFTSLLLSGVSVFFTVVSVYIAALNYFIRRASLGVRIGAFAFFSSVLVMLLMILVGARRAQAGLVDHLADLGAKQPLTKAGQALLDNARSDPDLPFFEPWSIDNIIRETVTVDGLVIFSLFAGFAMTYLAVCVMTFVFRWGETRTAEK